MSIGKKKGFRTFFLQNQVEKPLTTNDVDSHAAGLPDAVGGGSSAMNIEPAACGVPGYRRGEINEAVTGDKLPVSLCLDEIQGAVYDDAAVDATVASVTCIANHAVAGTLKTVQQ